MVSLGKCKCISSINFGEKAFNLCKVDKTKSETKESNSLIDINNYITPKIYRGEVPDLFSFKLEKEDFIVLLSESIEEKVSNLKILTIIYETLIEACIKNIHPDELFSECVQNIFKASIEAKVNGNLTCVIIFFSNFMDMYYSKNPDIIRSRLDNLIKINCDEFYNIKENVIKMKFNKKEKSTTKR